MNATLSTADQTRANIRMAAAKLIAERGAANWTLNGVAECAGISKGGLLYHYPSKQALLEGMLEHLLEQRREALQPMTLSTDDNTHRDLLIAYLDADQNVSGEQRRMVQALIAASASNPELLDPARTYLRQLFDQADNTIPHPNLGRLILIAAQGMQVLESLGLIDLSEAERSALIEELQRIAGTLSK